MRFLMPVIREANSLIKVLSRFIVGVVMVAVISGCDRLEAVDMEDKSLDKPLPINTRPKVLAIGNGFSVGIKKDGTVWSWGDNFNGALGRKLSESEEGYEPRQVPGLKDAVSVVASDCVLVLMSDGTVWSWGSNTHRQLGYDTENSFSDTPRKIPGLTDVVDIATSAGGSQALKNDGTVWGWGSGDAGLLGASVEPTGNYIRKIYGLNGIKRIEMRKAIDKFGNLWTYGKDAWRLGRSIEVPEDSVTPGKVNFPLRVVDVSDQSNAVYALLEDGSIWSWGHNNGGELGSGEASEKGYQLPKRIPKISRVILLASSSGAAVVTESGLLATWGVSASAPPPSSPLPRHDLNSPHEIKHKMALPVIYITGGMAAYAAIDANGDVWYWVDNSRGQRGTGLIMQSPDAKYWTTLEKSHWSR